jgi:hypothetical protein
MLEFLASCQRLTISDTGVKIMPAIVPTELSYNFFCLHFFISFLCTFLVNIPFHRFCF